MFRKIGKGKLIYRDQEKNVSIGVFDNINRRKVHYGIISITVLRGIYKEVIEMPIPAFYRLIKLIERMPEIKVKEKKNEIKTA